MILDMCFYWTLWAVFKEVKLVDGYLSVNLSGAGASFPNLIYQDWQSVYRLRRLKHANVELSFSGVGSSEGLKRMLDPGYNQDFAGTDTDLSDEEYADHPDLQLFPTMAGGVVIGFNLPGISSLNLTRDNIVGIYNGSIKFWDDANLQQQNPEIKLPKESIIPLARHDYSGTTFLFTSALAAFSQEFSQTYGVFSTPDAFDKNVVKMFGRTTLGIVGLILSFNYTVAYLSVSDAKRNGIPTARIQNKFGHFLDASHETIEQAMYNADSLNDRLTGSIIDSEFAGAYPIAGFTYLVIRMATMKDCAKAIELYRYIEWFLTSKEAKIVCVERKMVPLSDVLVKRILNKLRTMTCDGRSVDALALAQKDEEREPRFWRMAIPIIVACVVVSLLMSLSYLGYRHYRTRQILQDSSWKIDFHDIEDLYDLPPKSRVGLSTHDFQATTHARKETLWGRIDESWVVARSLGDAHSMSSHLSRKGVVRCLYMTKNAIAHENLTRFYGLAQIGSDVFFISESSDRGNLDEIIYNEGIPDDLKFPVAVDIATGVAYLHKKALIHGTLTSKHCAITKRWACKVGDWDYNIVCRSLGFPTHCRIHPETVKDPKGQPTIQSDCYSLGIVIYEIFARENLLEVAHSRKLYQQMVDISRTFFSAEVNCDIPDSLRDVLQASLSLAPQVRPTAERIRKMVKSANPSKKETMDCVLEKYEQLLREHEKLLRRIFPIDVADKLVHNKEVERQWYEQVTIYFSDIVGYTSLAAIMTPIEVIDFLDAVYTKFDNVVDCYDCYKVETIGDAYMLVSGLPNKNGTDHAIIMSDLALDIMHESAEFTHKQHSALSIRIGLHTGPVAAGFVGVKMPRYHLYGDTVNTASRMESTSEPMRIQMSETTQSYLEKQGGFECEERGIIDVKGKGLMKTYWLIGRKDDREENYI